MPRAKASRNPLDDPLGEEENEATNAPRPLRHRAAPPLKASKSSRARLVHFDTLRVVLIAGIIVAHACVSYGSFGSWAYQDVRETSLSSATETVLTPLFSIFGLFLMGLFFLIAGMLTPGSIDRKGPRRFAADRTMRLGVPLVVFTLLLWPLTIYLAREPILHRGSYWWWFTNAEPFLDNGPLWFVEILLLISLGYAAWRALRGDRKPEPARTGIPTSTLIGIGAAIAVASFAIRLRFPLDSAQIANLHVWEWPQCIGMFALGAVSARRQWLTPVPDTLRRACGSVALAATVLLPVMIFTSSALGKQEEDYFGGFGWPSLATCLLEGMLCVGACIWVLGWAQKHLTRPLRPWIPRSAYGAFLIQGPVLIGLALLMRGWPLTGDVKAVLLSVSGVAGSYLIARVLVEHTVLRRIL